MYREIDVEPLDFVILTVPRSGSHMLASALDSHPDIACYGESHGDSLGGLGVNGGYIKGCIVQPASSFRIDDNPHLKIIYLNRDVEDTAKSGFRGRYYRQLHKSVEVPALHYEHDVELTTAVRIPDKNRVLKIRKTRKMLEDKISTRNHIEVNYSDLCGNENASVINQSVADMICDYLGVARMPLYPRTKKPKIVEVDQCA